jgi:uncharacterized protein YggE
VPQRFPLPENKKSFCIRLNTATEKSMASGGNTALAILILLLVLAVLGILVYAVWFSPQLKNSASNATQGRSIDVDGSGTVQATPDVAIVQIGVETQAATVEEATRQNSAKSTAVAQSVSAALGDNSNRNAARNGNAAAENIQTTQYSVTPIFATADVDQQQQQQQQVRIGFRVLHELTVRIKKNDSNTANNSTLGSRASSVLDAATQAGANSVRGPMFQVSEASPAHKRARELAVRDAQRNAAELARLSGVALGPLQRISESASFVAFDAAAPMLRATSSNQSPPIQSGTSQVTYRVSASYGIGAAAAQPVPATQTNSVASSDA